MGVAVIVAVLLACAAAPSSWVSGSDPLTSAPGPSAPDVVPEGDVDGDGYFAEDDCNDANAAVHPDALEVWYDGVDSDCDGASDYDSDFDGFDALPFGTDCDDTDPWTYVGADEIWYDGLDEDCAGGDDFDRDLDGDRVPEGGGADCADEDPAVTGLDVDVDGFSGCTGDCDEADANSHPGASDVTCDGVDQDCDGMDGLCEWLFAVDLVEAEWVQPAVMATLAPLFALDGLGIQFEGFDALTGTTAATVVLGTLGVGLNPACATRIDLPTGVWLDPAFALGPFPLDLDILGLDVRATDVQVSGELVGTALENVVVTGLFDTRGLAALLPDACVLAALTGDACIACPDAVVACLALEAVADVAPGETLDLDVACPP